VPRTEPRRSRRRGKHVSLLNLADRALRPFFEEYDRFFTRYWQSHVGEEVEVLQWNDTSERHVRSVTQGLQADVITLSTEEDVETIRLRRGLLRANWQGRLPRRSVPFRSRLALVVRDGNPKQIRGWGDLMREDVRVATPDTASPDPFAPLRAAAREAGAETSRMTDVVIRLARTVLVLTSPTWDHRRDVVVTLESEAHVLAGGREGRLEVLAPAVDAWSEPRVAVLDAVVDARGTRTVAEAYAAYMYSPAGQRIAARQRFSPWAG
jgi:sulfate/thiosulfate transport system substrate-binding protein